MSLLGSIRKNSWLLILPIGLALLAFVIDPSFFNSYKAMNADVLGDVNGEKITLEEYNKMSILYANNNQVPEKMKQSYIWNELVADKLFQEQRETLGIVPLSNQDDYWDMVETIFVQYYSQYLPEGKFNKEDIQKQLELARKTGDTDFLNFFSPIDVQARKIADESAYLSLIQLGTFVTDKEVQWDLQSNKATATIEYVYVPYSAWPEADKISIEDSEVQKYITAHPKEFDKAATRDIQYTLIEGNASPEDVTAIKHKLEMYINDFEEEIEIQPGVKQKELTKGLKNTTDIEGFVNNYSDVPYNEMWLYDFEEFPQEVSDFFKSNEVGSVYGPYEVQNYMAISRLIDKKAMPDSIAVSNITITYSGAQGAPATGIRTKEEAQVMADSLLGVLQSDGSKFAELAKSISDAPNRLQEGKLGWVRLNALQGQPEDFKKFLQEGSPNQVKLIEQPGGYNILKIDEKKPAKLAYKIASILEKIEPSEKTTKEKYNFSRQLVDAINTKEAGILTEVAKQKNVVFNSQDNLAQFESNPTDFVDLAQNNQEAISLITDWAFKQDTEGKHAEVFDLKNGNHVVAYLLNKYPSGEMGVERARPLVQEILKKEKIAKAITDKLSAGTLTDLAQIAKTLGQTVQRADNVNFGNPIVTGVGREPIVGGAIFGSLNKISQPIKGENGVFIIKPIQLNNEGTPVTKEEIFAHRKAMQNNLVNPATTRGQVLSALKEKADIIDERAEKFSMYNMQR